MTARGKAVIAEIAAADDYGLRASDYALPKLDELQRRRRQATDWLADAEIKISYAVLDYARDARGGRIKPARLSRQSRSRPRFAQSDRSDRVRSPSAPTPPPICGASSPTSRNSRLSGRSSSSCAAARPRPVRSPPNVIPDGPVLKIGVEHEQVALLRKRLDMPSEPRRRSRMHSTIGAATPCGVSSSRTALSPTAWSAPARGSCSTAADAAPRETGGPREIRAVLINMERWRWLPHDLGAFYVHGQHPRVHAARRRGREAGATPRASSSARSTSRRRSSPTRCRKSCSVRFGTCRPRSRSRRSGPMSVRRPLGFRRRRLEHRRVPAPQSARQICRPRGRPRRGRLEPSRHPQHSRSTSRRDPTTCSARSSSCFPTSMTSTCTTRRRNSCSPSPCGPRATAACGCKNPDQLAAVLLKRDQGWSDARTMSAIEDRLRPACCAAAEDPRLHHLLHP